MQPTAAEQAGDKAAFSARLRSALGTGLPADLARSVDEKPQNVSRWLSGTMPDPKMALRLADALDVDYRWLVTGEGRQNRSEPEIDPEVDAWITLPRYDLNDFGQDQKPAPVEQVRVRKDWLGRIRSTSRLWVADMPSDAMPDVAREGDTLICQDAAAPLAEGKPHIFLVGGRPIVRHVQIRPEGLLLKAGDPTIDPILITPDQAEAGELIAAGRVLAAISLRSV